MFLWGCFTAFIFKKKACFFYCTFWFKFSKFTIKYVLESGVFIVCLQTLLFRNYFGKIEQLFTHPSNYCEPPNVSVKIEGANGINLFWSPQLEDYLRLSTPQ